MTQKFTLAWLMLSTSLLTVHTHAEALSAQQAQRMAAAAEQAARVQGFSIVISIVDKHGNLKHFHRMDGAGTHNINAAQLKATTSARFPLSSKGRAASPANPYASLPRITLLQGGLPIVDANGEHIGGIGISGATPELDAAFAEAALDGS